jgi:para-nitrobenzyl esterase
MDNTIVDTMYGKLRGTEHDGIYAFKGIPYGASTGGKMRFMPPAKPAAWKGIRDAFNFGHWCPQSMTYFDILAPQTRGEEEGFDEDCLCLNVWTPGPNTNSKRPVMFWCHGGGYAYDSGSWPWLNGELLARRGDVVVITINHRLNIFGFFHLADVGGEKYAASGNVGMLDLVAGLQWVHDNISAFGGDPNNVMIFGQSGGGGKVCYLLTMPQAKGLFHRAVVQSGFALRSITPDRAIESTQAMLTELEIKPTNIDKLQTIPADRLLSAMTKLNSPNLQVMFSPVMDGKILPSHPFSTVASPVSADIPIMIGCTTHEESWGAFRRADDVLFNLDETQLQKRFVDMWGKSVAARVISTYKKVHPGVSPSELYFLAITDRVFRMGVTTIAEQKFVQGRAPVYVYLFAWQSPAMGGKVKAMHTVEIPFVFYNTDIPKVLTVGGPEVKELAGRVSDAWVQFARNGNPNHKGLPKWPAYNIDDRATMIFDNPCEEVNDPGSIERNLWEDLRFSR